MAKLEKVAGATSEIWQIFIQDSSSTTGAGLTGLAFNTASLVAYYHRDTDTTATVMTLVTMTVGTFTSLGFKEIDATNMPGWYQLCPPNAAIAAGAKSCGFHLKGATNMAPLAIECQLVAVNPDSATAFMTSVATVTTVTNQLTAAQIATGVWQDATAGDFTTASSIGKSLFTSGNAPGAASGLALVGSNMGTASSVTGNVGGNVVGSVGSVTGLTASNLDTTVSSRMATYTQPTGFLAATFPSGTVANTTNITAGIITTVTNLTNAPTAGDFTATMKTSIGTAVLASNVAGITGVTFPATVASPTNITAATGCVLSATGSAAFTESYAADGATATLPQLLYLTVALLSEFSIAGVTLTAKKLDGSTTAGTFTLNDATTPTAITRAT